MDCEFFGRGVWTAHVGMKGLPSIEGGKEMPKPCFDLSFPGVLQGIDVLTLVMRSCRRGATTPSSLNTVKLIVSFDCPNPEQHSFFRDWFPTSYGPQWRFRPKTKESETTKQSVDARAQ